MFNTKSKRKNWFRKTITVLLVIFAFLYLNNTSLLGAKPTGDPFIMAHRGLGQTFPMEGITGDTCTASRIYEPEHPYIENTISSMEAAFQAGADMVELDVHPTADGEFAVFHDWTLDCRTDGEGATRDHKMSDLRKLDVGYGYTADDGKTFPFRDKGVGLMPTLNEVLTRFPNRLLLIHIKSDDPIEGELLAQYLSHLDQKELSNLTIYGGNQPIEVLRQKMPSLRVMSKDTLVKSLLTYLAIGWTGYVPETIQNTHLHLPEKYAPFLWGWPHRFLSRMEHVNTRILLVAGDGGWSEGFDSVQDIERLPSNYTGGIWTNRIDKIAPILH